MNVWAGILGNHVIGPVFLEDRLDAQAYLSLLRDQLPDLLEDIPLAEHVGMWFQHDGAPPHHARAVRAYLQQEFPARFIARAAPDVPVSWPPRSPDLTPLDFFLWGYVKDTVYASQPGSQAELRQRIVEACRSITPETLARVRGAILHRAQVCVAHDGRHFEHLL